MKGRRDSHKDKSDDGWGTAQHILVCRHHLPGNRPLLFFPFSLWEHFLIPQPHPAGVRGWGSYLLEGHSLGDGLATLACLQSQFLPSLVTQADHPRPGFFFFCQQTHHLAALRVQNSIMNTASTTTQEKPGYLEPRCYSNKREFSCNGC